jgi:hypothetical protein
MILHFENGDQMHNFFFGENVDHPRIYESITKAISVGILHKMNRVKVWEITFDNEDDDMIIECKREEWVENLTNALNWYTENEMYEECARVKRLIEKV